MPFPRPHTLRFAAALVAGVTLAGCGTAAAPHTSPAASHTARVAYAGSLAFLNETEVGPAFSHATGYHYQGRGGGSFGVAQEIASGTIQANVFESIGYAPVRILEPKWTQWAVAFASTPLVVAYNPKSPFAPQLNAIADGKRPLRDLFTLLASPGFHLGRTNPNTDPQGQAFYEMVELAALRYHLSPTLPAKILGPVDNPKQVFSEEGILTELQSGGLDAASAFLPEAVERHLRYIPLPAALNFSDPALNSWYARATVPLTNGKIAVGSALTVDATTVGKPDPAAVAFIRFLLQPTGQSLMRKVGYQVFAPEVLGNRNAVPQGLLPAAPASS